MKSLLPYMLFFGMFAFTIYETYTYSTGKMEEECLRCEEDSDIARRRAIESRRFAMRAMPPGRFH